ncbi:GIY-YIG nuclease family protein [Martelella mediterranea]|uniref:GIY-YIG nuclease family protein n=1 Tax=Martelella mediterranea TaxID=293089 RepID=UPI001E2CD2AA|nr:GIY-YIG nuclease family protein [Martelella mediterranea]MCD1636953.1 GIY-YIG nuclease family protein [Martelella mediterranea]
MVGPDPENDPNYRLYRHSTGCGHRQRIAVANMSSARFGCERCGECWSSAPSNLYLISFTVPNQGEYLKLGYSRNPQSRIGFQFGLSKGVKASLLKLYPMPTGHAAQKTEKRLHNRLRHRFPDAVVPASELSGWINVVSEIYRPRILTEIQQLLKTEIERNRSSGPSGKSGQDTSTFRFRQGQRGKACVPDQHPRGSGRSEERGPERSVRHPFRNG